VASRPGGAPNSRRYSRLNRDGLSYPDVAAALGTTPAAVSLAWLRAREGTVVPIVGARRLAHLDDNLAALELTPGPEHLRTLDEIPAPTVDYPAPLHGAPRAKLQFAGTTVDGEPSTVYPPLAQSSIRY
jgi:aryl-alcohol dehydrogenase-like predicted oxidoreductase